MDISVERSPHIHENSVGRLVMPTQYQVQPLLYSWSTRRAATTPVLVFVAVALWYLAVVHFRLWAYLAVPARPEPFLDLRFVLAALDSWRSGVDVLVNMPPGEWVRRFDYPIAWLALSRLPLDLADARWLGPLFGLSALACAVDILRPRTWREACYALVLLASPALAFGFERGNVDLLMLVFVWIVWRTMPWSSGAAAAIGGSAGAVAALLKLYPVAIFPTLVFTATRTHLRVLAALLGVATLLAVGWEWWLIHSLLPSPNGRYAFGARLLFDYLGFAPTTTATLVAGAGVAALAAFFLSRQGSIEVPARHGARDAYLLGGAVLGFCFTLAPGFDYRLVFASMLVPWLFALARHAGATVRHQARFCLGALLFALWAEFFDLAVRLAMIRSGAGLETALRVQPLVHLLEHAVTWAAMAIALSFLARMMLHDWRAPAPGLGRSVSP